MLNCTLVVFMFPEVSFAQALNRFVPSLKVMYDGAEYVVLVPFQLYHIMSTDILSLADILTKMLV